jgi:hypothetical protein
MFVNFRFEVIFRGHSLLAEIDVYINNVKSRSRFVHRRSKQFFFRCLCAYDNQLQYYKVSN